MKESHKCCICGEMFIGWGNNPYPIKNGENDRCCDNCNALFVIPARIDAMYKKEEN